MKRNILISIESNNVAHKNADGFLTPHISKSEVSKPASQNAKLIAENVENADEYVPNKGTPLQTDRWIYRIVVSALAFTIVSCIGSAVWLQSQDKEIPEIITGLGTGALGALAGLLVPTPSKD